MEDDNAARFYRTQQGPDSGGRVGLVEQNVPADEGVELVRGRKFIKVAGLELQPGGATRSSVRRRALSRAAASRSIPRTWPPGPTMSADRSATSPMPEPTSNTAFRRRVRRRGRIFRCTGAAFGPVTSSAHTHERIVRGRSWRRTGCSLLRTI